MSDLTQKTIPAEVLLRPQVTEKTTRLSESGVYTFVVAPGASKKMVESAVRELFKVVPEKVRIVNVPSKQVSGRGRGGTRSGFKKALVYLQEGDQIDLV